MKFFGARCRLARAGGESPSEPSLYAANIRRTRANPVVPLSLVTGDAAYHQGTVWAWLIGPYVDAYLRLHPAELSTARKFLEGFVPQLDEACIGSISEVSDAEVPYTPRGCIAQSWSVAEVLRCWVKTAGA